MHILAFDTCFDGCSACVAELGGDVVSVSAVRFERFETGHAERLMPMIEEVMAEAHLAFDGIDRIAVTTGPGTFTGTRIGVAAARALAVATGAEVVGVSSLAAMAEVARRELGRLPLTVVVDARRGEVYAQAFGAGGGGDPVAPPELLSVDDAACIGEEPATFVGSGAEAVAAMAAQHGRQGRALLPGLLPDAVAVAHLAGPLAVAEAPVSPLYLRPPDAKPQAGKAVARA